MPTLGSPRRPYQRREERNSREPILFTGALRYTEYREAAVPSGPQVEQQPSGPSNALRCFKAKPS